MAIPTMTIEIGSITAGCTISDRASSAVATTRRSRRHAPIAPRNSAAAHRNGSCPSRTEVRRAGFSRTATAHQPRRTPGIAQ